jgi:sigma54-dependent transcription regulator
MTWEGIGFLLANALTIFRGSRCWDRSRRFTETDRAKPGLFEVANGGAIFLDEIGVIRPCQKPLNHLN